MQTSGSLSATPAARPFLDALKRGQLLLPKCLTCSDVFYPPLSQCPRCGSAGLEWTRCSGRGRIYSYLINHRPAAALPGESWEVMAVVELEEGPRVLAPMVGLDDVSGVKVDMAVCLATEDAVLKFRPV
ncbi:MAG: OB-fold domain-containing protein [Chloroflexi bacterium]|nr:OB-fold domain-containing protein [Chloroflexota bacterium]